MQLTAKKANCCNSSGRIIGRQTRWAHHNPVHYCSNVRKCFAYYRYIRASSTLRRMTRKLMQSSRISRDKLKRCVEKNCVMHAYCATKWHLRLQQNGGTSSLQVREHYFLAQDLQGRSNREVAQFQMQKANASLKTIPMKLCESLIQIISQNYRSAQTTASTVGGQMNCKCTLQFLTWLEHNSPKLEICCQYWACC